MQESIGPEGQIVLDNDFSHGPSPTWLPYWDGDAPLDRKPVLPALIPLSPFSLPLALQWCLGSSVVWEDRGSDDGLQSGSKIRECILGSDSGHVRHFQKSIMVFRTLKVDL